jgi:hypothetical protein
MGETFVDDQKCHSVFFSSWVVFEKRREKKRKEMKKHSLILNKQIQLFVCIGCKWLLDNLK